MKYIVTSLFFFIFTVCNAQRPVDSIKKYCRFIGSASMLQPLQSNQKPSSQKKISCHIERFSQLNETDSIGFIFITELRSKGLGIDVSEFSSVVWKYISKQLHGQSGALTTDPDSYNLFLISKETETEILSGHVAVLWDGKQWAIVPVFIERLKFPPNTEFRTFCRENR